MWLDLSVYENNSTNIWIFKINQAFLFLKESSQEV